MIQASDCAFHTPDNAPYDWAETNYFSFNIPEANIVAWVYVIARAGIGATVCDVQAIDTIGRMGLESLYVDFQQHLPLMQRLEHFTLPNGLSLKVLNGVRDYRIDYEGLNGTALHLDFKGLMEPYDIHDPDMDPLAPRQRDDSGFGSAYANHFDMSARVTGTATFHGVEHKVDCVATMDHSWGPRSERGLKPIGWINGGWNDGAGFSSIWGLDQAKPEGWDQFTLAHAYVMKPGGEVRGIAQGRLRAIRGGKVFPTGYEMELKDTRGEEYRILGLVSSQTPWHCYSNITSLTSGMMWFIDGKEGSGMAQENWPYDLLAGRVPVKGGLY